MPHVKSERCPPTMRDNSRGGSHAGPLTHKTEHAAGYTWPRWTRRDPFDVAAWLLIAALLTVALLTFRDYAISNDEEVQHRYGELILSYYASGLTDRARLRLQESLSLRRAVRRRRDPARPHPAARHFRGPALALRPDRYRRHRRGLGHRAADRGPACRPSRRGRAHGLRPVVRLDVQPHQGHSVRRRDDGRDLLSAAGGPRSAAAAPAASAAVRAFARRRARAARAGLAYTGSICRS